MPSTKEWAYNREMLPLAKLATTHKYDIIILNYSNLTQAQRIRSLLAVEVMGSMRDAGIDAFIANSTTELAMCNLVGIPTVSVPIGYILASGASSSSPRRDPLTVGIFGWPNGEPEVGTPPV